MSGQESRFNSLKTVLSKVINPSQRSQEINRISKTTVPRYVKTSRIITYSFLTYLFFGYLYARKNDKLKLRVALTRRMSRFTGYMCNMPLPPFFRKYVYLGFGKLYGVNFDDMAVSDLN